MAYITIILIIFINLIFAYLKKNNLFIMLISLITLSLFFVYANTESGDLYYFKNAFETKDQSYFEIGYVTLSNICFEMGFSFYAFKFIIYIISVLLIYKANNKVNKNFSIIIIQYLVFILMFLSVALRSCICIAIIYYGICRFINKNKKRFIDYLVYIIIILLGSLFHIQALFAFIYLFVPKKLDKKIIKNLIIVNFIVILGCLILYLRKETFDLSRLIGNLVGSEYSKTSYFIGNYARFTLLIYFAYLFTLLLMFISYKKTIVYEMNENEKDFCKSGLLIGLLSALYLPLFLINIVMLRLLFPFLMYSYEMFSFTICKFRTKKEKCSEKVTLNNNMNILLYILLFILCNVTWYILINVFKYNGFNLIEFIKNNEFFK